MIKQEMTPEEMLDELTTQFGGRDPIKELSDRIKTMDKNTLEKMVLMSANTVGTALKVGEYESDYDAILHMNMGADMLLHAYDLALMSIDSSNSGTA